MYNGDWWCALIGTSTGRQPIDADRIITIDRLLTLLDAGQNAGHSLRIIKHVLKFINFQKRDGKSILYKIWKQNNFIEIGANIE